MVDGLPDGLPSPSARWESEEFRDELSTWVAGRVGPVRSMEPTKVRPWSTVWRVETGEGVFYAKQNCPLQNFEAALVAELETIAPAGIVPVAATDPDRGFLLTPDQGPVLAERDGGTNLRAWETLVVAAARLQRQLVPHVDDLQARCGLTRMRPAGAGEYAAGRIEAFAALPADDPRRLDPEVAARLRAHLPTVTRWGEQVAALGLPLTLNHNDLHAHNAFDTPAGLRFFDFADALVSHPLEVLLVPLNVAANSLQVDPAHPGLSRVAEAALEAWNDLAPMSDLRAALPAALQLGRLSRVESWVRCLASMTPAELTEYGGIPARWLGTLTADPPVSLDG